eukprot:9796677-Lingulodinium_polyedra.AAC.1
MPTARLVRRIVAAGQPRAPTGRKRPPRYRRNHESICIATFETAKTDLPPTKEWHPSPPTR